MENLVYSFLWVMQDVYHPPYGLGFKSKPATQRSRALAGLERLNRQLWGYVEGACGIYRACRLGFQGLLGVYIAFMA